MDHDLSRQAATSDDSEYTLSIEEALERYERAGHPRTPRSIQRYCAKSHLDCRRMETQFGEKYLISPASVAKHIAYIEEVRPLATSPDQPRQVASGVQLNDVRQEAPTGVDMSRLVATSREEARNPGEPPQRESTGGDQPRHVATSRDLTERYIERLEGEVTFLRGEVTTKNGQIKELTERSRETNLLIAGLQRMITPLLRSPNQSSNEEGRDEASRLQG